MEILNRYKGQRLLWRIAIMLISVTGMGLGTAFCFVATMGADPCSSMNLGLSMVFGLPFGVFQALMNILILIVVLFTERKFIGLGTLGNMFICGFAADFFKPIIASMLGNVELSIPLRLLLTIVGSAVVIIGCSLYMTANLGMAPYDAITFVVINKVKSRKLKYRWLRMLQDAIALLIGFLCGASVGIGTLIMVFATGPIIPICNKHLSAKIIGIDKIGPGNAG